MVPEKIFFQDRILSILDDSNGGVSTHNESKAHPISLKLLCPFIFALLGSVPLPLSFADCENQRLLRN